MEAANLDDLPNQRCFDYCIIGAGPAGLTAAHELEKTGSTIMIEAGSETPSREYDELRAETTDSLLVARTGVFPANPWTLRGPGGGMERYAGILFRYRTADFARSGDFPAATADPDWPFGYETLRPFYDELERKLGIARDSGADPTEPPSCPPVMPPHRPSLRGTRINAAFDDLGIDHFPTPLGINSQPYGGRPACSHCGFCNGTACPIGAKASMLRAHDATGGTVLVQGARAEAIHVGSNGDAIAVECVDTVNGSRVHVRARTFILAAGALNTCAPCCGRRADYIHTA